MPQQGFRRSAEQNRGLVGDIRLKSGPYLLLFQLLHGGRPGSGRPSITLENILSQERSTCRGEKIAVFTMCYANAHAAIWSLPASSWPGGHGSQEVFEGL